MRQITSCLLLAVLIGGCSADQPPPPVERAPDVAAEVAAAAPATQVMLAQIPAMVVQPPGARVAVATPFAGLVQSVHVQPGEKVQRGQLLAVLVSSDAMAMAADLARAQTRQRLASAEAARMTDLARAGIVAASRVDSAEAANSDAQITASSARRALAQAHAGPDGLIRLTAPIAGRVASISLDAGAAVDGMSAPIVIEAEGSRWLSLQIPERLGADVRAGYAVTTDDGQQGRLETVATTLDPDTRAFPARARLADGGAPLVSGRLISLTIMAPAPAGAVSVPAAAIVNEGGSDLVYVKTSKGFVAQPITRVGSGDPAVISSGLKPGDAVATSNLPELRAAVQR